MNVRSNNLTTQLLSRLRRCLLFQHLGRTKVLPAVEVSLRVLPQAWRQRQSSRELKLLRAK
jgi:hypothetical protein